MESREVILVEQHLHLFGYIVRNERSLAWCRTCIAQHLCQLLLADADKIAEADGVEALLADVTVGDHQIVALLTMHQELSVAVNNLASWSILHLVTQHVTLRKTLVAAVD